MIDDNNIIYLTGQKNIFIILVVSFILSSISMLLGVYLGYTFGDYYIYLVVVSFVLALIFLFMLCFYIRCPVCKNKWFLESMMKGNVSANNFSWMMEKSKCPKCSTNFSK